MAIVQISRITQRKGLLNNLPQLAGGELGWATDGRRLFIGNGTLTDGAPTIGNTEVLTEYSDILNLASSYTYKGDAAGYTVQTGPTSGDPVTRTLQSVFDDYACVKDFGATGDGSTDDTAAINRALSQLYCQEINPQIRRSLFFPAGVYRVTDSILIPPYVDLIGEGSESSIINFSALYYTDSEGYTAGNLVVNGTTYYRALQDVPVGTALSNTAYWLPISAESLRSTTYVARTTDSKQQIDDNIGIGNSTNLPGNVRISNLKFATTEIINVFLIQSAVQVLAQNCTFSGPYTRSDIINSLIPSATALQDVSCIAFDVASGFPIKYITFDSCLFNNSKYATDILANLSGVTFTNSNLFNLYEGILVEGSGSTGVRITQNLFDAIAYEGIIFSSSTARNVSGYNTFLDVGNSLQGAGFPITPNISILSNNNVSIGDMFERNNADNNRVARVSIGSRQVFALDNGERYKFGSYRREAGNTVGIELAVDQQIFIVPSTQVNGAFIMEYRFQDSITLLTRYGRITVVGASGTGTISFNDDYVENGPIDLVLNPVMTAIGGVDYIVMQYSSPTSQGTLSYSLSHF